MKKLSVFVKSLSICLIITVFTNSFGYAMESVSSNINTSCGEWKVDDINTGIDQRILAQLQQQETDKDCNAYFTLTNNTGIYVGNFITSGKYTLELKTINDNANIKFDRFLIPRLENIIQTSPDDFRNIAVVNIRGDLSWDTYYIDTAIFALEAGLELIKIPCVIPTDQIILTAIQASPAFSNTSTYLRNPDFERSKEEFARDLSLFYEKANSTLVEIGIECAVDLIGELVEKPLLMAKIISEYAARIPNFIFDLFKYTATSASVTLVYRPSILTIPSSENWIAFLNETDLWLVHSDGSDLTQVTNNDSDNSPISSFKWSPDGGILAYSQSSNIYLYDIKTSETTILETGGAGGFDWSLNGKQIIYDTSFSESDPWSNNGLWIINLENSNKRQVIPPSSSQSGFMDPQWSSEGSYILFAIPGFEPAGYGVAVFSSGKSLGLPLNPRGGGGAGTCKWAPSELIIACVTETDEFPYEPELRIFNARGNILQRLVLPDRMGGNSLLNWSPDGEKLAISYYDKGSFSEIRLDILWLNTNDIKPLTRGFVSDWSSDGKWILSWDGSKVPIIIYLTNATSGDSFELAEGIYPIWQP